MAEAIKMPKMSDTMTEGVLAKWHKKVGDKVKAGDVVAEIETDKATMDFESFQEGTLLYIGVEEGKAVPVDALIAVIGEEGEDYKSALDSSEGSDAPKAEEKEPADDDDDDDSNEDEDEDDDTIETSDIPAAVIRMPLLSDTMTEGVINKWNFKVGDKVKSDDSLADVETDKATMEVVGYEEGTLLYMGVEEGQAAKVNQIIAIVGKEGTDIEPLLKADKGGEKKKAKPAEKEAAPVADSSKTSPAKEESSPASSENNDSRVKASPLAKKMAEEKGISLNDVKGSAEGGRIVKKDIEDYKPAVKAETEKPKSEGQAAPAIPQFIGEEKFSEKPVSQMRKIIAKRLSESLFTAPHFYLTMSIDMDQAMIARAKINEYAPSKVSFNDLVLKACAVALKQHPAVNSSWLGDKIRYNEHVNIGVAVAVEDGLLVPVVRFADGKSLTHISAEVKDFAGRAKSKKLQPADWEGSTFTISNLGMFGIDEFTAIINPPDACILAVGGISQIPVVKNGQVVPGNVMKVTLSCDHRVVDGATGAAFLQTLKALLEEPVRLLA